MQIFVFLFNFGFNVPILPIRAGEIVVGAAKALGAPIEFRPDDRLKAGSE
jgi:hypothetical protein